MRSKMFMTATATAVALVTATPFAQTVTYDFDKAAPFASYKTYAWATGTHLDDPLNHARIVSAIDRQLAMKGLARIDAGGRPDVLVAYHASFDRNLQISTSSSGWGPYRLAGSRIGSARAQEIVVGTLAVDVMAASTKTIVWRGLASTDVDAKAKPEKRERNINRAAAKLFKHYPPVKS